MINKLCNKLHIYIIGKKMFDKRDLENYNYFAKERVR